MLSGEIALKITIIIMFIIIRCCLIMCYIFMFVMIMFMGGIYHRLFNFFPSFFPICISHHV